jgi:hypothetical protein
MDTSSIPDRTAVWQAMDVYRSEYQLSESDEVLAEVRSAYETWQSAVRELHVRYWEGDIDDANDAVEMALDQMLKPSRTSASLRAKRERWTLARERLSNIKAAHLEAQSKVASTREEYVRILEQSID